MTAVPPAEPPPAPTVEVGWEVVDEGPVADELRDELWREAAPTHVLHLAPARAIARCRDCDQVAFHLGQGAFAVVELTWSAREEPAPRPATTRIRSFDALREYIARHRHR